MVGYKPKELVCISIFLYKSTTIKQVCSIWRTVQKEITTILLALCEKWLDENTKYMCLQEFMGLALCPTEN